jgi:hypothetical protein
LTATIGVSCSAVTGTSGSVITAATTKLTAATTVKAIMRALSPPRRSQSAVGWASAPASAGYIPAR